MLVNSFQKPSEFRTQTAPDPIRKIFHEWNEIPSGSFSKEEIDKAIQQMKNDKAPGSDGLPPEFTTETTED